MGISRTVNSVWIVTRQYSTWIDIYIGEDSTGATLTRCVLDEIIGGAHNCSGSGRYIRIVSKSGQMELYDIKVYDMYDVA